jgi:hypothetical protein
LTDKFSGGLHPAAMKLPVNCLVFAVLLPAVASAQSFVMVGLEEFNLQTSSSGTTLQQANFVAEVSGLAGVNSVMVGASDGVLWSAQANLIPQPDSPGDFFYRQGYGTVGNLLMDFPADAVYGLYLDTTSGYFQTSHLPGAMTGSYGDHLPVAPLFTISGVNGTWVTPDKGLTQFRFVPTPGLTFTVTLNPYAVVTSGGHYAYLMKTRDLAADGMELGEVGEGPLADTTPFVPPSFTFTYGLATNTDTTYGFVEGSVLAVEAAFYNFLGLAPAGLFTPWGAPYEDVVQAFIFGNETQLLLVAIPEASSLPLWLGVLALAGTVMRRRRR